MKRTSLDSGTSAAASFSEYRRSRPRVLRGIDALLKLALIAELGFAIWDGMWLTAAVIVGILAVTLLPHVLRRRFRLVFPYELEIFAIIFVFASLFLGEVRGYYTAYPWWDSLLHASSGLLLGIFGFLLVYALNERDDLGLNLKPGFVAFFAFLFALGMGTLWEIFEFSMDQLAGTNMQKPMFNDPSGLTDTMWDLILDAGGAAVISLMGYVYLKSPAPDSFLERWIVVFIQQNPRIFGRNVLLGTSRGRLAKYGDRPDAPPDDPPS
ncbi:MAG TPA: hypothetical protein VKZ88_01225 [Fibrobacteria bacterium]|nr:hypothetical protein [Fibrobacteria bacterium]